MSTANFLFVPISGGGFVVQSAFLKLLARKRYRPNVIFSASGGGVASFIANNCGWDEEKMDKILSAVSSNIFISRPFSIVSLLAFPIRMSLYYKSSCLSTFIAKHFPPNEDIIPIEHWALTVNTTKSSAQMNCNFPKGSESFDPKQFCPFITTHSASGDVQEMANVIYSSAAIPFVVQPGKIAGDDNVDGGMWMPSSLSLMASGLSNSDLRLQIVYVSSYNVFEGNVGDSIAKGAISVHIHATCLCDVERGIDLLRIKSNNRFVIEENIDDIGEWFERNSGREYFLFCFPETPVSVNPISFTGKDVIKAVDSVVPKFKAWVSTA